MYHASAGQSVVFHVNIWKWKSADSDLKDYTYNDSYKTNWGKKMNLIRVYNKRFEFHFHRFLTLRSVEKTGFFAMKTKARCDIFFFMTSLLCSKTRRVLGYFCNNRRYISLFSGYLHVLVIRVVMEGLALKASGLVNFPASAFHKWPCFRLLTTIVILVRGLKLWIRTKRNHWNWDLFAGISKFGSYRDSIT